MITEVKHSNEYWVKAHCDNCGLRWEDEEFNLMPDENSLNNKLMESGWERLVNNVHYCPDCIVDEEDVAFEAMEEFNQQELLEGAHVIQKKKITPNLDSN